MTEKPTHPMFESALRLRDLRVGLVFIVWDMAAAKVVRSGVIISTALMDADDRSPEVYYADTEGRRHKFELVLHGVLPSGSGWSHLITLPVEYLDKLDDLPRIPKV